LLTCVAPAGRDLLDRVDASLQTAGAPPAHRVWSLIRAVDALPGVVVRYLVEAAVDPLSRLRDELDAQARRYPLLVDQIPAPVGWAGDAAAAFAGRWREHVDQIGAPDRPGTASGALAAMVRFVTDVQLWRHRLRSDLAAALAECLASSQAVRLRTGDPASASLAAADIAAHVLAAVDAGLVRAEEVCPLVDPAGMNARGPAVGGQPGTPGGSSGGSARLVVGPS
jgi:hypothetical protein